jgi:manganese/iron transport system permease protein
MDWLTDPLQFDFFVRALLAVVLVSVLCALVGAWVVLRGLSYIGDAMSHAVLPGIVGAFLTGGNLLVGALVASVLTALGIGAVGRRSGLKQDSAIGIVFVGMFALGVVMLSRAATFTTDLSNFLIGILLAAVLGAAGGVDGLYLSYYTDTAPGATIVLVNTALFVLALVVRRREG